MADVDLTSLPLRPSPVVLRLAAAIIDFTLMVVVVMPVLFLWTVDDRDGDPMPTTAANWVALAILVAYPIVAVGRYGCTAGKWICTLRVVGPDDEPAGWGRAVVRFVVTAVPFAAGVLLPSVPDGAWHSVAAAGQVVAIAAIYAPIVVDDSRRGLHDRLAGTRVVTKVPAMVRGPNGQPTVGGIDVADVLRSRRN